MLTKLKKLKERQEGFTIIEVLIVLAIAGLIMVVVFLAVPHLEASQQNNARDTDANNLLESVSDYESNDGGSYPTTQCTTAACTWITYKPGQLTTYKYYPTFASAPTTVPGDTTAYLIAGATCSGLAPVSATTRNVVVWYGISGSTGSKCTQSD